MADGHAWRDSAAFKPFYKSKAWKNARGVAWDRAHGLCEKCMERGEIKPAHIVHHTIPLNEGNVSDPDISLNPERLIVLCKECHENEHRRLGIGAMNGRKEEEPRVGFDSDGNVVRLRPDDAGAR